MWNDTPGVPIWKGDAYDLYVSMLTIHIGVFLVALMPILIVAFTRAMRPFSRTEYLFIVLLTIFTLMVLYYFASYVYFHAFGITIALLVIGFIFLRATYFRSIDSGLDKWIFVAAIYLNLLIPFYILFLLLAPMGAKKRKK